MFRQRRAVPDSVRWLDHYNEVKDAVDTEKQNATKNVTKKRVNECDKNATKNTQ